jgi:hypothetical protein
MKPLNHYDWAEEFLDPKRTLRVDVRNHCGRKERPTREVETVELRFACHSLAAREQRPIVHV